MVIYNRYSLDGRLEVMVIEDEDTDKVFAVVELDGKMVMEQAYDYGDTKETDIEQYEAEIMAASYVIGARKMYNVLQQNGFTDEY